MEFLLSLVAPYLPVFVAVLLAVVVVAISLLAFFFDVNTIFEKLRQWRKDKLEFEKSLEQLKNVDYFIAHITHIGGNFSMIYSMFVYSNEEGGFYFNPAKKFVSVGFNRGGDLMIVSPSELSSKAGFKVESISSLTDSYSQMQEDRSFCHVSLNSLKNEYDVKFTRQHESDISR